MQNEFSLERGLSVQNNQLLEWSSILKTNVYLKLENHCNKLNKKLNSENTGYDVFRGTDMQNWIFNNLMDRH